MSKYECIHPSVSLVTALQVQLFRLYVLQHDEEKKKKKRKKKQTHKKKNEKPSNVLSFNHLCFSTTIPLGNPMHRFSANKRRFYWRTNSLLISEAWLTFQWIPALCTHSSWLEMAGQSWPGAQHVAQCPARASCESLFRCCFPLEDAPVSVRASPPVTQNSREPRRSHQAFPRGETSSRWGPNPAHPSGSLLSAESRGGLLAPSLCSRTYLLQHLQAEQTQQALGREGKQAPFASTSC